MVRLSDKLAYIYHDMDDAIRGGILTEDDIPADIRSVLGNSCKERLNRLIHDVVTNSMDRPETVSYTHLFKEKWEHTETILTPFPMGKMKMPASSAEGDIIFRDKRLRLEFRVERGKRMISCDFKDFCQGKPFYCEITLEQLRMDSIVMATPWADKNAFYYNQKINCMPAEGYMSYGDVTYWFSPKTDYGTLDWGRGVWTYDNTWYWGSGNGTLGGKPFGFNIGYGFGDTSAATENILFYDGKGHKLDDVTFHIPEGDYMLSLIHI